MQRIIWTDELIREKTKLLEAEERRQPIFKEKVVSQDASEVEEIHRFLFAYCRRMEVETVPEHDLLHYMSKKIPVNKIDYFLKALHNAGLMKLEGLNNPGSRKYRPLAKTIFTG